MLLSLPGAAAYPLLPSRSVSECLIIGIGFTSSGVIEVEPEFKLIFEPLMYVIALLAYEASPDADILMPPSTFTVNFPIVYCLKSTPAFMVVSLSELVLIVSADILSVLVALILILLSACRLRSP